MERFVDCIAHMTSEGQLLIGEKKAGLFDCGMMFCAAETIANVKKALCGRPLNYIFASHTHYDHIGALPFFRKEWPEIKLVTNRTGAEVLLKDTPRRVIRELSNGVGQIFFDEDEGEFAEYEYSDDDFHADIVVATGDIIDLGGVSVEFIETPGHTRDCMSFFIKELELLVVCETLGVLTPDGIMNPAYLTSYKTTEESIKKLSGYSFSRLSIPHSGLTSEAVARDYLKNAAIINSECRDMIVSLYEKGSDESEILEAYKKKYGRPIVLAVQPLTAFMMNARATVACTLREFVG